MHSKSRVTTREHWWVVECQSKGFEGQYLFLEKRGVERPYRFPVEGLLPGDPCADWMEHCTVCGQIHTYNKADVSNMTIDPNQTDPGPGSPAFRDARSTEAAKAFEVGQKVRLKITLAAPANITAGTIGELTQIYPREVSVCFGHSQLARVLLGDVESI
jgi:hypothetical protein